jgi:hypothetical protein
MPLATVHDVLSAREPFVVERVDEVVSGSPEQRIVAVVAPQPVIPLAAVDQPNSRSERCSYPFSDSFSTM